MNEEVSGVEREKILEDKLVKTLISDGYEYVTIHSEEDLLQNFKKQIEKHNQQRLVQAKHAPTLTDKEFKRLLNEISGKDIFTSASLLRDDSKKIEAEDGSTFYIELMNTREWCNNEFQVAKQIRINSQSLANDAITRRYDVTLLINGLPVVQIELKRPGIELKAAFNQIKSYGYNSYHGLFNFLQLFVISDGELTKYYANNRADLLKYEFTFPWADIDNRHVDNLHDFAIYFLTRCHVAKMIARYMILKKEEHRLVVMRPYQVHAVEKLMRLAKETCNNGYVWHTTGSGKTLTSFKLAQLLTSEPEVGTAIFLVDRKDLDGQTRDEFNKFQENCVETTTSTWKLKQLIEGRSKIIVSTIQKMANLCKDRESKRYIDILTENGKKVVFIIDECHRSNFGEMHKVIKKAFAQGKAQYFGFTGTPIFTENKTPTDMTTADVFGECVHKYTIKEAIADRNVLGFSVDYVKTINATADMIDDKEVEGINTDSALRDPKRIKNVTEYILKIHDKKTLDRTYNALFATKSIPMLIQYYHEFKKQQEKLKSENPEYKPLKIGAIFTCGNEDDGDTDNEYKDDFELSRIMDDFNDMFETSCSISNRADYLAKVTDMVKKKQLDILIVVNMFLTGFDSTLTNTLYIDKNLNYQGLIQAFSRTNRIESAKKQFGNIVCFQTNKKSVDRAVTLYSSDREGDPVLREPYSSYLNEFKEVLKTFLEKFPTPESVEADGDETLQNMFIQLFRQLTRLLTTIKTFVEFEFTEEAIGISESTYNRYLSRYKELYVRRTKKPAENINNDIDFEIELIENQTINVHYILELIKKVYGDEGMEKEKRRKRLEDILRLIEQSDKDSKLFLKSDLIKIFVFNILPSKESIIDLDFDIDEEFRKFIDEEGKKEAEKKSKEFGVTYDDLMKWVADYAFSRTFDLEKITSTLSKESVIEYKTKHKIDGLLAQAKYTMANEIMEWIRKYVGEYE